MKLSMEKTSPIWMSSFLAVLVGLGCIKLSQESGRKEDQLAMALVEEKLVSFTNILSNEINTAVIGLKHMAHRWEDNEGTAKDDWFKEARRMVADFNGLTTVEWVDKHYHVRWIEPLKGNSLALGLYIASDEDRKKALDDAAENEQITLTAPFDLVQGYRAFIAYVPIYIAGDFDGFIVGIFDVDSLFGKIIPQYPIEVFDIQILDGHSVVFQSPERATFNHPQLTRTNIKAFNREWSIAIAPKKMFMGYSRTDTENFVLLGGLLLSLFVGFSSYMALISTQRNKLLHKKSIALQGSEERHRSVVENAVDGLITISDKGNIESFNPASEVLFGYKSEEVIGKNIRILMPKPYHDEHDQYLKNYRDTGIKKIIGIGRQVEGQHKNGATFPFELSVSEITIGQEKKYSGILHDITERRNEENIFKEIYNITLSDVYSFHQKMDYLLDAGRKYFQLSLGIISRINGNDCEVIHSSPSEAIEAGTHFDMTKTYCVHTLGSREVKAWHHVAESEIVTHPCYENFGLETYIGATIFVNNMPYGTVNFTDKSPRQSSFSDREKVIVNLIAQWLGGEIHRNQILKEKELFISRLSDSNEELERFAYVCSHDIQEPLRMIRSFSEKLQTHFSDSLENDAKGQRYLKFVMDGAARAQQLIADILAYSSVDQGSLELEKVNMNELVDSVRENFLVNLEKQNGSISRDNLPNIDGNRSQLYQLLQNLISNGLKYQKPDGKPNVHIGIRDAEKHWEFSIKDNGIGMEECHLTKIFDVFKRLHRKGYAGTGIGLSICKKVVERHNGTIRVESVPGSGSAFFFTIPKESSSNI